jgi:hypothetical protein
MMLKLFTKKSDPLPTTTISGVPPKRYTLTASMLCKEALLILRGVRHIRETSDALPANAEALRPMPGLFGLLIFIEDGDLELSIDGFAEKYLVPTIRAWAPSFHNEELGDQSLMLPLGFLSVSNERYDGLAVRCIITKNHPVGDRRIPSRLAEYYEAKTDEIKVGPCSMAISFWVHTPDAKAQYQVV